MPVTSSLAPLVAAALEDSVCVDLIKENVDLTKENESLRKQLLSQKLGGADDYVCLTVSNPDLDHNSQPTIVAEQKIDFRIECWRDPRVDPDPNVPQPEYGFLRQGMGSGGIAPLNMEISVSNKSNLSVHTVGLRTNKFEELEIRNGEEEEFRPKFDSETKKWGV